MKKIIGFIVSAMLFSFALYAKSLPSISIEVPKDASVQVRVKTANGSEVQITGSETKTISGADEVRELGEEKEMQTLVASDGKITFTGDIREFDIKDNKNVTAIDVSNCPKLEVLYCAGNVISSLDLSKNKKLERVQCYNNKLSTLDVKNQKSMTMLWCGINELTALDLSACKKLTQLRCYRNAFDQAAMDALVRSLPKQKTAAEARVRFVGKDISNALPSSDAILVANKNGWKILDSDNSEIK